MSVNDITLRYLEKAEALVGEWAAAAEHFALGKPSRGQCLTHALLVGAEAAEIHSARYRDNPYSRGSDWAWAWMTGFDLGRRINKLTRQRKALAQIIDALDPHIPPTAMVPMDALFELVNVTEELKEPPNG